MTKKELLQAIENSRLASYVAENWWKMARTDLTEIIIQLLLTMHDNELTEEDINVNELFERLDLE